MGRVCIYDNIGLHCRCSENWGEWIVATDKDYNKCRGNYWRLEEGSWQKIIVLGEYSDNVSSVPESTGQRGEESDTGGSEATLGHYRLLIAAATPCVLRRACLTPASGKLVLPQLQMLTLPCCQQALKPRSQPGWKSSVRRICIDFLASLTCWPSQAPWLVSSGRQCRGVVGLLVPIYKALQDATQNGWSQLLLSRDLLDIAKTLQSSYWFAGKFSIQ